MMGKSLKILFFMYILIKISFAQIVDPGIFCHRGGNGKFVLDMGNQILEVQSLFSARKRSRMFDSEKQGDHQLLSLEGSSIEFTPVMTTQGYMNVKAFDMNSRTFINIDIKNINELLSEEKRRVDGDVTIFSFDLDPDSLLREYNSSITCELD